MQTARNRIPPRLYATRIDRSIEGEDRTLQSQAEEADINVIVARFIKTGQVPSVRDVPSAMVFTEVFDFQSAMNAVLAAQNAFSDLPAEVRYRFGNSPQAFLAFCEARNDDGSLTNLEEMRKLGIAKLADKVEPEKVMKVEVVNQEVSKPA